MVSMRLHSLFEVKTKCANTALKEKFGTMKGELKEVKRQFRDFRHRNPSKPLCLEFAAKSKTKKLTDAEMEDMLSKFEIRQAVFQTHHKRQQQEETNESKSQTNHLNYIGICTHFDLDPFATSTNAKLDAYTKLKWITRSKVSKKEKAEIENIEVDGKQNPEAALFRYQIVSKSASKIDTSKETTEYEKITDLDKVHLEQCEGYSLGSGVRYYGEGWFA